MRHLSQGFSKILPDSWFQSQLCEIKFYFNRFFFVKKHKCQTAVTSSKIMEQILRDAHCKGVFQSSFWEHVGIAKNMCSVHKRRVKMEIDDFYVKRAMFSTLPCGDRYNIWEKMTNTKKSVNFFFNFIVYQYSLDFFDRYKGTFKSAYSGKICDYFREHIVRSKKRPMWQFQTFLSRRSEKNFSRLQRDMYTDPILHWEGSNMIFFFST